MSRTALQPPEAAQRNSANSSRIRPGSFESRLELVTEFIPRQSGGCRHKDTIPRGNCEGIAMNIKTILFPTDFSDYNDAALHYASRLAAESGATLHIVHIHERIDSFAVMGEAGSTYALQWEDERRRSEQQLGAIAPPDPSVKYERHLLDGVPSAEIVAFAADHDVDLIVMASHGRTGFSRLVMGSVAEAVLRKAPCPVLVVKQPHVQPAQPMNEPAFAVGVGHQTQAWPRK
jgi:universal stress protein A